MSGARLAHSGSQRERNTSTSSHEMPALRAATFIFVTTSSPVASGRTATKAGSDKSFDQKSALEKPLPNGNARIIGIASVQDRIHTALPASFLRSQESGPMTRTSSAPMHDGKSRPVRRHSYQS